MRGYVSEARVRLPGDDDARSYTVLELANLRDKGFALPDYVGRTKCSVDYANGRRRGVFFFCFSLLGATTVAALTAAVGLRRQVQGDVLFGDQSRSNPGSKMLVEKPRHVRRTDILPTFEEASREDGYSVGVCLYQICHDFGKLYFFFQGIDLPLLVGKQGGEGVDVVVVDARDVRVRDDDEGEIA